MAPENQSSAERSPPPDFDPCDRMRPDRSSSTEATDLEDDRGQRDLPQHQQGGREVGARNPFRPVNLGGFGVGRREERAVEREVSRAVKGRFVQTLELLWHVT